MRPSVLSGHVNELHPVNNAHLALSPSARALRAHEPGQSLPQGLAAGLSRIHLIPPSNPISPPLPSGGSAHDHFLTQQAHWGATSANKNVQMVSGSHANTTSLVTKASENQTSASNGLPSPSSIAISGNANTRRPWIAHSLSSPLTRPVASNDEDVGLFPMDEET